MTKSEGLSGYFRTVSFTYNFRYSIENTYGKAGGYGTWMAASVQRSNISQS